MIFLKVFWHLKALLKILFYKIIFFNKIKIGNNFTFRNNFSLLADGGKIIIGNNVFFNNNCSIVSHGKISIDDNCIFGENVKIYDNNHRFNNFNMNVKEQGFSIGEIKIGKNCWLANNVIVLKGAEIGDNVLIGAGCIIKEKIPSNTIVSMNCNLAKEPINYLK